MNALRRPKVAIIGSGGTISSLGTDEFDTMDYPEFGQKLELQDVLKRVPHINTIADIVPVPFKAVSSTALTIPDLMEIRQRILTCFAEDRDLSGILVLHGTGSLEETAFFLHLTVDDSRPVVVVGAQRPINAISSDAPMNLINAVRVAASADARNRGVLVILNDEIWSARDVVKTSNYRLQTFRSPDYGMLGQVDPDRVVFARRIEGRHTAHSPFKNIDAHAIFPRVDIVYAYLGADDVHLNASVAAGAKGIVCAGFAPGFTSPAFKQEILKHTSLGLKIVLASRAHHGRVVQRRWVVENKMLTAEDLSPQKARIALMLGLLKEQSNAELQAVLQSI
jgi:L-asparaginase